MEDALHLCTVNMFVSNCWRERAYKMASFHGNRWTLCQANIPVNAAVWEKFKRKHLTIQVGTFRYSLPLPPTLTLRLEFDFEGGEH